MQFVSFMLDQEVFCVEVSRVREILNLLPITKVPQTPSYMMGVINLRGQVVPVIDVRLKLGMSAGEQTQDTCIIVMEVHYGEEASIVIGALADAVSEVLELQEDQIEPAPRLVTKLNTEFIQGMGKINNQFLILIDIDKVFGDDEIAMVQDAGQMEHLAEVEEVSS